MQTPQPSLIVGSSSSTTPGDRRYTCHLCGDDVFIAKSGQKKIVRYALKAICLNCFFAKARSDDGLVLPTVQEILSDLQHDN